MKIIICFFTLFLMVNCKESTTENKPNVAEIKKESKFEKLLSKFKNIEFDTLKVYSSEDYEKYEGVQLDSLDAMLFPTEILNDYLPERDLYACYKFTINENKIGLIARTPSTYVPSSIKLFIYNKTEDKLQEYIEIAETWGDAGEAMEKTSWIIKDRKNVNVLLNKYESYDHSAENENDTIVETWNTNFLLNLSKLKIDTLKENSEKLKLKYKNLLK